MEAAMTQPVQLALNAEEAVETTALWKTEVIIQPAFMVNGIAHLTHLLVIIMKVNVIITAEEAVAEDYLIALLNLMNLIALVMNIAIGIHFYGNVLPMNLNVTTPLIMMEILIQIVMIQIVMVPLIAEEAVAEMQQL
jgi:hypothetical protein